MTYVSTTKATPTPLPMLAWWVVTPHHVAPNLKLLFLKRFNGDNIISVKFKKIPPQNITLCIVFAIFHNREMMQKLTVWRPSKAVISASSLGFGTCTLSAIFRLIFRADGRGKGSDVPGKSTTETRGASNVPWVIWIDGRCIFRMNTLLIRVKREKIIISYLLIGWLFDDPLKRCGWAAVVDLVEVVAASIGPSVFRVERILWLDVTFDSVIPWTLRLDGTDR